MPDHKCPTCDGRLRPKVRRLMFVCRRCEEIVVDVPGDRRVLA